MATDLNLLFVNNTGLSDDEVFITFQNPSLGNKNFDVKYGEAKTPVPFGSPKYIMSTSLSLKTIGKGGFSVANLAGGIVFVSYGNALSATETVPSFIGSSGSDYKTQFQPFELTRVGGSGDQGDMTAINYFTAPMSIKSYNGGVKGTLLQSKAYKKNAIEIGNELGALTNNDESAVVTNQTGELLQFIRYIGPSSYGLTETNPFASMVPYLKAIHEAGQKTIIKNNNAFNQPKAGGKNSTNYNFTLNLTAEVKADSTIQLDGDITTTIKPFGNKPASQGETFKDATVTIPVSNLNALNHVIYGQVIDSIVKFGPGWSKLKAYMKKIGLDSQGAWNITKNMAIGEISSGLLMGFFNSSVVPVGHSQPIKDMASCEWWKLDPIIAFSDVQKKKAYYNQYANVLYKASSNEVYSIPYSDRLGTGPLVNSVSYNGMDVDTWEVTLEPPLPTGEPVV